MLRRTQSRAPIISRRLYSSASRFHPVRVVNLNLEHESPVVVKKLFVDFPAISRWFKPINLPSSGEKYHGANFEYLETHGSTIVPLELTRESEGTNGQAPTKTFERLETPLQLLLESLKTPEPDPSIKLYLAQCPLADLHPDMQADLPTPPILKYWGKGDIYGSSLWMGRPPTRTPLHRDPNPNLFVQLAGRKVIRLMNPEAGHRLYMSVRAEKGHANMRGEEMMAGEENDRLEEAVWGERALDGEPKAWEAVLESGEGLFIPLGWWHSVRGIGEGVNCSVGI